MYQNQTSHCSNIPAFSSLLIWTIGILVMVGLTIKDLCPLLIDYIDEDRNVAVQIDVVQNTIKQPTLFVCIPVYPTSLKQLATELEIPENCTFCEKMASKSWDVWKGANGNFTYENLAESIIRRLLENTSEIPSVLNASNLSWNAPILDAAWEYLSAIKHFDDTIGLEKDTSEYSSPFTSLPWPEKWRLEKLTQHFYGLLCEFISISEFPDLDKRMCLENVQRTPVRICEDRLCLSVSIPESGMRLMVNPSRNFGAWESLGCIPQSVRGGYWVFEGNSSTGKRIPLYVSTERNNSDVAIQAVIYYSPNLRVREGRPKPCFEESSHDVCNMNCKLRSIMDACSCIPFQYRTMLDSEKTEALAYCNTSYYQACNDSYKTSVQKCHEQCDTACEYVVYQWQISEKNDDNSPRGTFSVAVILFTRPFIEFKVTIRDTPEKMVSQIGGVANFYLGVSGLSLCAALIYLMEFRKRWYGQRQAKKPGSEFAMGRVEDTYDPAASMANKAAVDGMKRELMVFLRGQIDTLRQEQKREMEKWSKKFGGRYERM